MLYTKVCDFTGSTTLSNLMEKLESVKYSAALAVTGAWRETSREKLYLDLGWESLSLRRWSRRLMLFYKVINNLTIINNLIPDYTRDPLPPLQQVQYSLRELTQLGKYEQELKNINLVLILTACPSGTHLIPKLYCHLLLLFSRQRYYLRPAPLQNQYLGFMTRRAGRSHLTQLRLCLSKLNFHKFQHNLRDTINPMCPSNNGNEDTEHFLLLCPSFGV